MKFHIINQKRKRDAGLCGLPLFMSTSDMLQMVCKHIYEEKFNRLHTPILPQISGVARHTIYAMKDSNAGEKSMARRTRVALEIEEGRLDNQVQITNQIVHSSIYNNTHLIS